MKPFTPLQSFVIAATAVLIAVVSTNLILVRSHWSPAHNLLRYQVEKIKKLQHADIVYLGDSTLGNAFDARWANSNSPKKHLNLALNENYGFAGVYTTLQRLLRSGKVPNQVVIMATPATFTRSPSWRGLLASATWTDLYEWLHHPDLRTVMRSSLFEWNPGKWWRTLRNYSAVNAVNTESDYVNQTKKLPILPTVELGLFRAESLFFLAQVQNSLQVHNRSATLILPPLAGPTAALNQDLIQEICSKVIKIGITCKTLPFHLPLNAVGDSFDHVHPDHKLRVTAAILTATAVAPPGKTYH